MIEFLYGLAGAGGRGVHTPHNPLTFINYSLSISYLIRSRLELVLINSKKSRKNRKILKT